jgi:DNA-binding NarL/FixJ family response regulator
MGAGWLIAILAFGLLGTGVGVAIRQGVLARRELEWLRADVKARLEELERALGKLEWDVEAAVQAAKQMERALEALPEAGPPRPSINVSRRAQVLRLYRQGERPEQIAAALSLPLNEVELLLKVHQIAMGV